ncbi:MAG: xanthine phosphoribosyltransferase [Eubacteriales bacterium]|nr:xanthine phosphoribosyltransferase [Clostridiales bacterium]MDY4887046.1 xanthine phosphoribosyltransferase [Eubacteriales bacterium]MDD6260027.1 xanthine phosphoribosyltransferase [Clostridiales bacterium]MDD7595753.1 xanthine phosphoribosyltransferase [Clostridiales bacterium]MDY5861281.1 xanthine phosphoribosyltransferase [Eubacteriales bacterium]
MEMLKQMIKERGELRPGGVVVVSGFLNHRMNTELIDEIGREFYRIFADEKPTLILTVEASGIGIACLTARYFGVDVLFAKKSQSKNLAGDTYSSLVRSFTRGTVFDVRVDKNYISANDRVLLIDDFLADGEALKGLIDITNQAGATVVGAGICIEKAFQPGGDRIRKMNINLHSLVRIGLDANGDMIILDQ